MAVSLYDQYREVILAGNVNAFHDLCEFHPISEEETAGTWNAIDLRELILRAETSRDIITAAFDKEFIQKTDITHLSYCLSDSHDFVRWLLENMNHAAMRDWRAHDTGETLLQKYMYAFVNVTEQSSDDTALYMIETIGIDPLAGLHTLAPQRLIENGYFRSVAKLISMGIALEPDMVIHALGMMISNSVYWLNNGFGEHHVGDLDRIVRMIDTLVTGGYNCLTDDMREQIITAGFHEECLALAALLV